MADPLTDAAYAMAPPAPGASLFDMPRAGEIRRRYAMSLQNEEAARQRFEDQVNVDRALREREKWDRDTVEYKERENFKNLRGETLQAIAEIDPDADDYEERVSGFLASSPRVALEDDAVQALLNVKQNRYTERVRDRAEENRIKQQELAAERRVNQQIRMAMAEEGFDPTPFDNGDNFDAIGALRAFSRGKEQKDLRKLRAEQLKETDEEDAKYFNRDPEVLSFVRTGALSDAEGLLQTRLENAPVKFADGLLDHVFTDTEEAFVARAQKPEADKPLVAGEDARSREPLLKAYANAARAVYSAARGVQTLRRRGQSRVTAPAEKAPAANPYFEALKTRLANAK